MYTVILILFVNLILVDLHFLADYTRAGIATFSGIPETGDKQER